MFKHQDILQIHHSRYACKKYDKNKIVQPEDLKLILEVARLSPSSFGFEPWKFIAIKNENIKKLIAESAWGTKDKIMDATYCVLILARKKNTLQAGSAYLTDLMQKQNLPPEAATLRMNYFKNYSEVDGNFAHDERNFFDWACKQTYIPLANMMTTAAMLNIDSTAVEGFNYENLNRTLVENNLYDGEIYKLSVMLLLGYRAQEIRPKSRQDFNQVIEIID